MARKTPKWSTAFEDNAGGFSMMRICLALTVLVVLINWSYLTYSRHEMPTIPPTVVTLVGTLAGAKVVQRFGEKGDMSINSDQDSK